MLQPWHRSPDFLASLILMIAGIVGASVYANLSHDVEDPNEYAWFPPFKVGVNANDNKHLGAEYLNIAEALVSGRGYADPFKTPTGPTAWMPPVLTLYEAGLLWMFDKDKTAVMNVIIISQVFSLCVTGLLTLVVARRTAPKVPSLVVVGLTVLALVTRFHTAFQVTHDSWLVLLAVDFLVAGIVWGRITESSRRAVVWGFGGGLVMLISPITGLCWGVMTAAEAIRHRQWRKPLLAIGVATLVMMPWVVRNAIVFKRFIPVKSNLAYELYQSQLLNDEGRLKTKVFGTHPYAQNGTERAECAEKGEMAFLDAKRAAFWHAVRQNPMLFVRKAQDRLLAATVDYSPMDEQEYQRPTVVTICYLLHPLPIFAAISLLLMAPLVRHPSAVWAGLGLLVVYLLPYVVVSYYDRYEFPLWGLKVLLLAWWLDTVCRGVGKFFGFPREEIPSADTTLPKGSLNSRT
ncbi:hypothetical protein [Zavarzinella formosa]|uniref:hypothetical protein n=1 Tax=Zavarzinella formosa TaxID=360055 RepID=UPI0012F807A0|nr:hypothetical protein [Zavarzinella formosa]